MRVGRAVDSSLAYRLADPDGEPAGDPVLCVHGFPESSYMWRELLGPIAASGRRAIAPDLPGYGDSPPDPPGTWERHVEALERFRAELGLERVVLAAHDWGGLIGIRWACEHPEALGGLVASNTGFFPDGKWHGMADVLRTEGAGDELVENLTRDLFAQSLQGASAGIDEEAVDEYWKAFETGEGRRGALELYRSGDFSKIEPYAERFRKLDVPALALWGENDPFAPVAGAYRFAKELADCEVVVVEGTGHFVYEDAPERCATEVTAFLERVS